MTLVNLKLRLSLVLERWFRFEPLLGLELYFGFGPDLILWPFSRLYFVAGLACFFTKISIEKIGGKLIIA